LSSVPPTHVLSGGEQIPFTARPCVAVVESGPSQPAAPLSPEEMHALDELAQEAYSKYTDHLLETSQLAPAQWTGLNESTKQAWRRVVSHVKAAV